MVWEGLEREGWHGDEDDHEDVASDDGSSAFRFDFSVFHGLKDYYSILEVDYDAPDDVIRSNYIRLALKWHPDKRKGDDAATSRFQEINDAYSVLSNPAKRQEYDKIGIFFIQDHAVNDYLNRHKSLILTCNGLGIRYSLW
ncbi:uncharacterized protein LOC144704496 [Wolffia australiana]